MLSKAYRRALSSRTRSRLERRADAIREAIARVPEEAKISMPHGRESLPPELHDEAVCGMIDGHFIGSRQRRRALCHAERWVADYRRRGVI